MSEQKVPPSAELSLKYLAWDFKQLVQEIKKLNETLSSIKDALQNKPQF